MRPGALGGRPSTAALGARRRRRRARAARAQGPRHGGQSPTPKGGARKREGHGPPSRGTEHGRTGADDDDDGRPGPHARRTNRPEPQGARPDADARRGCPPERPPAAPIPDSACPPAVCPSTPAPAARQSHLSAPAERLPGRPLSNVKKKITLVNVSYTVPVFSLSSWHVPHLITFSSWLKVSRSTLSSSAAVVRPSSVVRLSLHCPPSHPRLHLPRLQSVVSANLTSNFSIAVFHYV